MASNYAFHFHLALSFRLCTLKNAPASGGLRPQTPCQGFAPGPLWGIEVPQWGPVVSAPPDTLICPNSHLLDPPWHLSSRTMHWLIVHVKQWSCFVVRKPNSLLLTCGCSTSRILNRLITEFGDWCRNESTKRQHRALRAAAKVDEHLGWLLTECNRQINWSVSKETRCLCSYTRRSLWTVACRMFCDCIKHVQSVTFLTSLFCCKLLKYDLRIWQGNVVTVLRWGGQNWKHFRTLHVTSYENRLKCQELFKLKRVTFSWNTV